MSSHKNCTFLIIKHKYSELNTTHYTFRVYYYNYIEHTTNGQRQTQNKYLMHACARARSPLSSSCAKSLERMRTVCITGKLFGLRVTPLGTVLTTRTLGTVVHVVVHSSGWFCTGPCHREGDEVGVPIGSMVISGN